MQQVLKELLDLFEKQDGNKDLLSHLHPYHKDRLDVESKNLKDFEAKIVQTKDFITNLQAAPADPQTAPPNPEAALANA